MLRKYTTFWIIAIVLLLCDLLTLAVLFSRLDSYTTEFKNVISLLGGAEVYEGSYDETPKVWIVENDVELFKHFSEGNTEKIIYPSAYNEYTFTLENPSKHLLDYELTMEAYVTGTDYILPVNVNLYDYTGKYIIGSENQMLNVLQLNSVDEKSKLSSGRFAVYTLNWEWAFESGNDDYDTMLGNLAVDDDITLTVKIKVVSSYEDSDTLPIAPTDNTATSEPTTTAPPVQEYGISGYSTTPKTGYSVGFVPLVMILATVSVLLFKPKRTPHKDDDL